MSLAIGPGSFPPGVQFASQGAAAGSIGNAPIAVRTADGQLGVFTPNADPTRFTVGRPISVVSAPLPAPVAAAPSSNPGASAGSSLDFIRRNASANGGQVAASSTAAPSTSADTSKMVTVSPRSAAPMWMTSALGYFSGTSREVLPLARAFTNPTNVERARESFNQVSRDVLPAAGAFTGSRNNLLSAVGYFNAATRGLTG